MTSRALSFGSEAAAYERFRLGYPDELFEQVLSYAAPPIGSALEIGAGTGKATRGFAARGVLVTATDPDAGMLAELRKHVPSTVVIRQAALEELPPAPDYDLVYAAAALHWTAADRWDRIARMLRPGGTFASFGGGLELADRALEQAVRAERSRLNVQDPVPSPDGTQHNDPVQWPGSELQLAGQFTDVRQSVIKRRVTLTDHEYAAHLSTVSAVLVLPSAIRAKLLERVAELLPPRVTLNGDIVVHLARLGNSPAG